MEKKRYRLQIKERRIIKDWYKPNELSYVMDGCVNYMVGFNKREMQKLIDNSLNKDDYRIVSYEETKWMDKR